MKLFETIVDGKTFGYVVGQNGVTKIVKKAGSVIISVSSDQLGEYTSTFDLRKLAMYSIG